MRSVSKSNTIRARMSRLESLERRDMLASVTLPAQQDNSLFEHPDGALSNGAGDYLFVG